MPQFLVVFLLSLQCIIIVSRAAADRSRVCGAFSRGCHAHGRLPASLILRARARVLSVLVVQELGCSKCLIKCNRPECEVRCPVKHCEKGRCPKCETVCRDPICHTECSNPEPKCEAVCENPVCDWRCHRYVDRLRRALALMPSCPQALMPSCPRFAVH
jgi:hypothetical protein